MSTEKYRIKQLELQILFDDLFEGKNPKTEDTAFEYAEYLKELIYESCVDYINDNINKNIEED